MKPRADVLRKTLVGVRMGSAGLLPADFIQSQENQKAAA